ncbi:SsrA-binding protein [Candidatus Berkelbacteria bacterium CG10_big_fil_rev_8_21_14_0_10_43_13]|uniref:SsrA-binding protein n=1 Tax=Candidatus Berkelbacteria bacterium CG10_big_fil_rev_8_21_14_0_10_43_13 TaxID=1974514 RepID=A0A2H0W6P8_9BACT|nr:MAG: SsrA-binding protein [Candidatus Berkelbacteria bacterium CG10_big_fil_rev_8_21_14_0_10_43_13]
MTAVKPTSISISNKKAYFDYQILDSIEAGIALVGLEIKALRAKKVSITGSYVKIINGEVFWLGGNFDVLDGDRQRTRKLLLHSAEIDKLIGKSQEKGLALVPLKLYMKRGRAKLEVGICKGLKKYDKREVMKKKDLDRDAGRAIC